MGGFGYTDVDIVKSHPALLRSVFHDFPNVLHAAWPYIREVAFLASTYPFVDVNVGLAIPLRFVRGWLRAIDALFKIAPLDKLMYSNGAHSTVGNKIVTAVAAASVAANDLTMNQAEI